MDTIILRIQTDFQKNPFLETLIKELSKKHNLNLDTSKANTAVASLGEKIKASFSNMTTGFMKADLALGGISRTLQIVKSIGDAVIQPANQIEQLRLRLVSLYQSADRANEAFDKFKDIASRTPATLQQVVEAGASLKAFGMNAEDTLASVSDLAAYMGMDVVEAASAVGRAFAGGAGAADILRERGVLELIKSFKGIDDLTKLSLPEFRKVLIETLQSPASGIAGSADRIAKSYAGAMSNLDDAFTNLRASLGNKLNPVLADMARSLTGVINDVNGMGSNLEIATHKGIEQRVEFESLIITYTDLHNKQNRSKIENELYKNAITQLLEKYPNYFQNIDLEKGKWQDISTAIDSARTSLTSYLNMKLQESIAADFSQDITDKQKLILKLSDELTNLKARTDLDPNLLHKQVDKSASLSDNWFLKQLGTGMMNYETYMKTIQLRISNLTAEEQRLQGDLQKSLADAQKKYSVKPIAPITEKPSTSSSSSILSTEVKAAEIAQGRLFSLLADSTAKINQEYQQSLADAAVAYNKDSDKYKDTVAALDKWKADKLEEFNQKQADLEKQIADKKLQEQISYYEEVKFLDTGYYKWKAAQIDAEVKATSLSEDQKSQLIKQRLALLEQENKAFQNLPKNTLLDQYNTELARLASLKTLGALTYDELTSKLQLYVQKIKLAFGSQSDEYKNALEAMQTAQLRIGERLADHWKNQNSTFLSGWNSVTSSMVTGFNTAWNSILDVQMSGKHRSERIWDSMRNRFMSNIGQMAASFIEKKFMELAVTLTVEKSKQAAILTSLGIEKSSLITSIALGIKNAFASLFQAIGNVWRSLTASFGLLGVPVAIGASGGMITAFNSIKKSLGFATGGLIKGSGSPTQDNIPIMASNGEFIVNARSVAMPGVLSLLHSINRFQTPALSMAAIPGHYATGGLISSIPSTVSILSINELIQEVKNLRKDIYKAQPTFINHAPNPIEIYKQGEMGRKLHKGY